MRKTAELGLVCFVLGAAALLPDTAVAHDCGAHRFGDLGKKAATLALAPTERAPEASGVAQVKLADGGRSVLVDVGKLPDPSGIRPEYLTYVAWAIPLEGPIVALGELRTVGGKARLAANVASDSFGLIVTAEPHFAASQPSDSVVLQSQVEGNLGKQLSTVEVGCALLAPDRYAFGRRDTDLVIQLKPGPKTPAELLQARNARKIAELAGAERLASDLFAEASEKLVEAEQIQAKKPGSKDVAVPAVLSVTAAEQAYVAALARREQEREAEERQAQQAREQARQEEEQRAAREAEEARERTRRDDELRAMQERQQQLERDIKAEADRRTGLEQQLASQRAAAAASAATAAPPVVASGAPPVVASAAPPAAALDPSSDLRAERASLEAERARLLAERVQTQADLQAERTRVEAERATMRAQLALEQAERDREENKIARAEIEAAKREAEAARVEAERGRHEAELAAERARNEVERARLEAEIRAHEAERQRLAQEAATAPAAVTPAELEAARQAQVERAKLEVELAAMHQSVEQERARVTAEQQANALQQELDRTKVEAERSQLHTEVEKLRAQLDAERATRQETSEKQTIDRAADERRKEEARAALAAERSSLQVELERQQAEFATAREAQAKRERELETERARMRQDLDAERVALHQAAETTAKEREDQRVRERSERRAGLLTQLTEVLEAKDTERGLVVNMSDISFDTGRFELTPVAREKLARAAGILLAYPGLKLALEGHTDSSGSAEGNQMLSEKRAWAVRDFLASQGVANDAMIARGFGASRPVASNETADGRKANRRIECVISGAEIGGAVRASALE